MEILPLFSLSAAILMRHAEKKNMLLSGFAFVLFNRVFISSFGQHKED